MKKIIITMLIAMTATACIPVQAQHRYERARAIENRELRVPIWKQNSRGYVYRSCQWRQDILVRYQERWWCTSRKTVNKLNMVR